MPAEAAAIEVVAGALIDAAGRVLIADRPAGKAFAGRWEFPGGKRRDGESARDALRRELIEELGVESWRGEPAPLDGQRLRWCTREELAAADILEADRPIVTALLLPALIVRPVPGRGRPAGAARTGWLVERPAAAPAATAEDLLVLLDPAAAPAPGTAAAFTTPDRFRRSLERRSPAGLAVASAAEARAAAHAGADFLLVRDRAASAGELDGIAAAGLPWYLDVTRAAAGPGPAPTGRLWWR